MRLPLQFIRRAVHWQWQFVMHDPYTELIRNLLMRLLRLMQASRELTALQAAALAEPR